MNQWNWTASLTLAQDGGSDVLGAPGGASPAGDGSAGQTTAPGGQTPPPGGTQQTGNPFGLMLPLLIGLMFFMVISSMFSGKKEKKKRAELLNSLKKRDKVQTVGGIIGTITEVKGDEVVLRTEGVRMRFSRSAIQQVLKSARGSGDDGIEEMELENEQFEDELETASS